MNDRQGRRGRPRINPEAKAAFLNMRTTPELRARVEASQRAHNTPSLVGEVERLVRRGLEADGSS